MCVYNFIRALDDLQRYLIARQGRKSIVDEWTIRNFHNNDRYIIKKCITPHVRYELTYNYNVNKSEQLEAASRGANAEHTKPGYHSKVSRYSNATNTRSCYPSQLSRPEKGQLEQNSSGTPGARSTASEGTKDTDWHTINKTISEKERMRRVPEKIGL